MGIPSLAIRIAAPVIFAGIVVEGSSLHNDSPMKVTALHRYAVKGLSYDALDTVALTTSCFPDDRRFALLKKDRLDIFQNEYINKENFVCAFNHPETFSRLKSNYRIFQDSKVSSRCCLEIEDRSSGEMLLGPVYMDTERGREELADFVSAYSGTQVVCVTSPSGEFQFGNTSSGLKSGDRNARSIHIIFKSTIDALQEKIGISLNPSRFRPNIVLDSADNLAFSEFGWIGRTLASTKSNGPRLKITSKTVRCEGVGIDPMDPDVKLDIPSLLVQHFPEQGPFLGVYCILETPGTLALGDELTLLD